MPQLPTRVLVQAVLPKEEGDPRLSIHPRPHCDPTHGGPPGVLQYAGVEQVIVIYKDEIIVYRWATLELIPDEEMFD